MKKYFTHLMALVACFLCSMNANAQFSATIEMYPSTDYSNKSVDFNLDEVATALGTDAATLVSTLDAWMAEEEPTEFLFQLSDFVPTSLADYTANDRGFWMTLDGTRVTYGQKETEDGPELQAMYNVYGWDAEAKTFTVAIGQMPNKLAVGDEGHVVLVVAIGDKKATFDMTLKIIEEEKPDIPVAETDINKLTIVGEKTVDLAQYPNTATKQTVDLTGVAEALGMTDELLANYLSEFLFTPAMELRGEEDSQKPYMTDSISNEASAGGIGWWLAAVWDEENDAWSQETARCVWGDHAAYRSMYSEQYSYNAETYELSSVTGLENNSLELGTVYKFHVYVVYGNKAYHITNVLTLTEKPHEDPSIWQKIGEEDQELSFWQGDYTTVLNLDVDAIAGQLGCEVADLVAYGPADTEGNISDEHTANNGGIWFSGTGLVCSWGSSVEGSTYTFYIEPVNNLDYSSWNVGQNSGATAVGETYTTTLYFFAGDKGETNVNYYAVNVSIKCEKEPQGDVDFESVATWNLSATTQPYNSYDVDNYPSIDLAELEALIGTSSPTFYSWVKTEDGTDYSKWYNCDPKPGFWMDNEGYNVGWNNNSYVGCSYLADGTFQLFQMPNVNKLGDVWKTQLFLVNGETGKMVTINLTVIFGEAVQVEEIGQTDATFGIGSSNTYYDVDFTEAVTGFGVSSINDVFGSNCMRTLATDGTWTELMSPSDGVPLDETGSLDVSDGNILAMAWIYAVAKDDNTVTFEVEPGNITIGKDNKVSTKLAFEYEPESEEAVAKRFVVNITLVDAETLDGVHGVKAEVESVEVYDLAGRRINNPAQKGIYIVGGRKVVR